MSAPAPFSPTVASNSTPASGARTNSAPPRSAPPQTRCLAVLWLRSTRSAPSESGLNRAIAVWWKSPSPQNPPDRLEVLDRLVPAPVTDRDERDGSVGVIAATSWSGLGRRRPDGRT